MLKILLIRFSSIGDIVLTSPVIRCLKKQRQAEIHFLTKRTFRSILEANPHVDKIFTIDQQIGEALPKLKTEKYDYLIDLHKNWRSFQVRRALDGQYLTFDKLNIEKWLLVNFKINRLPRIHIVDRYMASVQKLGVTYDGQGLDYFIPQTEQIHLPTFFQKYALPGWESGYIAFAIGAAHATKRLPTKRIIALCQQLQSPIVLLGGPGDSQTGEQIETAVGKPILNTCGKLSLHQSASLVQQARQVISHDTGLMHIAAAFRKPIVSIWGNTVPAFGMYPFYPGGESLNKTMEVKNLNCRPCSKIGHAQCPKGHFRCMQDIDLGEIQG